MKLHIMVFIYCAATMGITFGAGMKFERHWQVVKKRKKRYFWDVG